MKGFTVTCWRCKKERSITDVLSIPFVDNRFFSWVRYMCGFCIVELADYLRPKYAIEKEKPE